MAKKVTISAVVGSDSSINHNLRKNKDYPENADPTRNKDNLCIVPYRDIKSLYHELFDSALTDYNAKQVRGDRKIKNYYEHISHSKKEHPYYEMIVQIGDRDTMSAMGADNRELARKIYTEYIEQWQIRNPNLILIGAVLHMDEATPHLHIDFVPVSENPEAKRGMLKTASMKGALRNQGIVGTGKGTENERAVWAEREKSALEDICKQYGLERDIKGERRPHEKMNVYKQRMRYEEELAGLKADVKEARVVKADMSTVDRIMPIDKFFGRADEVTLTKKDYDYLVSVAKKGVTYRDNRRELREAKNSLAEKEAELKSVREQKDLIEAERDKYWNYIDVNPDRRHDYERYAESLKTPAEKKSVLADLRSRQAVIKNNQSQSHSQTKRRAEELE